MSLDTTQTRHYSPHFTALLHLYVVSVALLHSNSLLTPRLGAVLSAGALELCRNRYEPEHSPLTPY